MKKIALTLQIFCLFTLLAFTACEPNTRKKPFEDESTTDLIQAYKPERIEILPLTYFLCEGNGEDICQIKVYVSLLGKFGCQKKNPGVFRFELYEAVVRSAEQKGRRIMLWPDFDLTDPTENNKYWRDFMRAYEFILPIDSLNDQSFILQATFMCPTGKRHYAEMLIKHPE
ncbi:MAG: hypothetical protein ACYSR8_10500 [Planctomycetota bacterium]|jgi:hypothetical protein